MVASESLRGVLLALKEDIDDEVSWLALADIAREDNDPWPDAFDVDHFNGRVQGAYRSCLLLAQGNSSAVSQIESVGFHRRGYAEPGYSDPKCGLIATGDWNSITRWEDGSHAIVNDAPELLGYLLERLGVGCEWEDEWADCCECGKLVRTQPDCMDWRPHYHIGDGELVCFDCRPEEGEEEEGSPEEDDYTTTDRVHFYQSGRLVVTVDESESWQDAIRRDMEESGYFPNVWFVSDHGNAHLMNLND